MFPWKHDVFPFENSGIYIRFSLMCVLNACRSVHMLNVFLTFVMLLAPSLKKNVQGPSVTLQSLGRRSSIKWSRNNPVKSPGQLVFPLWMLILRVGRTPFSRAARTAGGDRAAERSWLRGTPASQAHRKKKREFGWARHVSQVCTDTQSMSAAEAGRPSERRGLAKVTENGAADSPVPILPLRFLSFIVVFVVRGRHANQIAFPVPAFRLPSVGGGRQGATVRRMEQETL